MDTPNIIELPETCDTQWAAHFHETLVQDASLAGNFRLTCAAVNRVTTPAIQLILALGRSIEECHGQFEISEASEVLSAAFADLGLTDVLQNWSIPAHA